MEREVAPPAITKLSSRIGKLLRQVPATQLRPDGQLELLVHENDTGAQTAGASGRSLHFIPGGMSSMRLSPSSSQPLQTSGPKHAPEPEVSPGVPQLVVQLPTKLFAQKRQRHWKKMQSLVPVVPSPQSQSPIMPVNWALDSTDQTVTKIPSSVENFRKLSSFLTVTLELIGPPIRLVRLGSNHKNSGPSMNRQGTPRPRD